MQSPQTQVALQDALSNLERLDIRILRDEDDSDSDRQSINNLRLLLAATQTVTELDVSLVWNGNESPTGEGEVSVVVAMFFNQTWPRIRRLDVGDFVCTKQQLLSFIDRHSSTLDTLILRRFALQRPPAPHPSPYTSVIRFVWQLGQLTNLHLHQHQCRFKDLICAGCVENWCPKNDHEPSSLFKQFQEYVCKRGSFPYASHSKALFSRFADRMNVAPEVRAKESEMARRHITQAELGTRSTDLWTPDEIDYLVRIINECLPFDEVRSYLGDESWLPAFTNKLSDNET